MRLPCTAWAVAALACGLLGAASADGAAPKAATLTAKLDALATTLRDKVDDAFDAAAAKKDPASTFDYVVVGSGPGGASVAAALSADPATRVLLLEAGEDRDADPVIAGSQFAWELPVEYVPEYMWQMVAENNEFTVDTHAFPRRPLRRRALLHSSAAHLGGEQYMGGRLLGGSSSVNGEQAAWPTARLLDAISAAAGGDPAWGPDAVYALLRDLETFSGSSPQPRGTSGPLDVKQAPANGTSDVMANDLVAALSLRFGPGGTNVSSTGPVPTVLDYNDPATPVSIFPQWQLTQQPSGARASSSTALLSAAVRARPNLVIATRATAMRVLFDTEGGAGLTPRARGVQYTQAGVGRVATATREVIVAAGHRSSLLLEASGVGDPAVIGPLLAAVGRSVVVPLPGVGRNLGNDGIVLVALDATNATSGAGSAPPPEADVLYGGGAFLPWPGSPQLPTSPSLRFTQVIGAPHLLDGQFGGKPTLAIGLLVLNTTSRGTSHIQSADPLYAPLVDLDTFNDPADQGAWLYAIRDQLYPVVTALEAAGYALLSPARDILAGRSTGATLDWVFKSYIPSHHWFGTCAMGTDPAAGAVVDAAGRVHGVAGLRVADASMLPLKLDGNTGIPAYVAGGVVARKILEERAAG